MSNEKNTGYHYTLIFIAIGIILSYLVATKYFKFIVLGSSFGFVDYGGYVRDYLETTSVLLGISGIVICTILGIWIWNTNKEKLKIKLGIIGLLIGLLTHGIFYLANPMERFDENPSSFGYMDSKEEFIEDTDKYLGLIDKYGSKYWDHFRPFKTLEEHIKAIEFSIAGGYSNVWTQSIKSAGNIYGYDELFKKYKDKTAETEYLSNVLSYNKENWDNWLYESYEGFYYLKDHGSTKTIRDLSQVLYEGYEANKNKSEIDFFESDDNYKEEASDRYRNKLLNEKGLNLRVIYRHTYRKDKFERDENGDYYMIKDYYMTHEVDKQNWN